LVNQTRHHAKWVTLPHSKPPRLKPRRIARSWSPTRFAIFWTRNVHNSVNFPEVDTADDRASHCVRHDVAAGQVRDLRRAPEAGKDSSLASLSRGDPYVVVDLDAPAPADTLKAIGSKEGVLMIRGCSDAAFSISTVACGASSALVRWSSSGCPPGGADTQELPMPGEPRTDPAAAAANATNTPSRTQGNDVAQAEGETRPR
jgi:hypothetical protein